MIMDRGTNAPSGGAGRLPPMEYAWRFLEAQLDTLTAIETALENGDTLALRARVQDLGSSASRLGLLAVAQSARALEASACQCSLGESIEEYSRLRRNIERLRGSVASTG